MAERRRLTRRYVIGEVSITPAGGGDAIGAEAIDVNAGGVGLYLASKVEAEKNVLISITLNTEEDEHVTEEVKGVVLWVRPVGNRFSASIKFDEAITSTLFPALSSFIDYTEEGFDDGEED